MANIKASLNNILLQKNPKANIGKFSKPLR
jgi:hypothetical protein